MEYGFRKITGGNSITIQESTYSMAMHLKNFSAASEVQLFVEGSDQRLLKFWKPIYSR